jgi:predicted peptidase
MLNRKVIANKGSLLFMIFCSIIISCSEDSGLESNNNSSEARQVEVRDSEGFSYLLFTPKNKVEEVDGKLPLIISLHGIGERGSDLQILKSDGLPKILDGDVSFPFMVISPQCPLSTEWYYTNENNIERMRGLLDDAIQRFPIDTNRIYITGFSMGGIGSWYFIINLPEYFAAAAPIAFRADGWSPCDAKEIPVWAFHGSDDSVIPFRRASLLVDQFRNCGGDIEFTVYDGAGHDSWTRTYNNNDLYSWLLNQSKD